MENGQTSHAGTLKIGVKLDEKQGSEILTLASLHKTEGHDFYLKSMEPADPTSNKKSSILYGVVQTPEDYDEEPCSKLGFQDVL